ncbi:hypothetical protein [Mesorhizobium sp.]|uniref:hypothetical protein n=1 Tax=Mesorhizobium sp. TaxID=1871066 RepID=UPI000FEAAC8A|nr:hypothetical protein [Mesorhizobium sp.]RWK11861.1 MAG: hypothetical protein EOR39_07020 [Mesorhizobium sp.]TIQ49044.1 MAG: hypothetical protein E5X47_14550 [Mesorhizobium sp.]TIQ58877.1 MAG: hypothetical protein E5X46_09855 [Mesorhizobium sp.]
MSYQIEIHGYGNEGEARQEAERLSRCHVNGIGTTIWLNARGPDHVVDRFDSRHGWENGPTDPGNAGSGFSLLIELDAEADREARRVTEAFCAKARVGSCALLMDLETGVDEYSVEQGWRAYSGHVADPVAGPMVEEKSQQTKPGGVPSLSPETLERLRGDIDAASAEGMDVTHWRIKQHLLATGREWTRQNYIDYAWAGLDLPDEWDEGELPEDLQNWSKGGP